MPLPNHLDLSTLQKLYAEGLTPEQLIEDLFARIESSPHPNIWITLAKKSDVLAQARSLSSKKPASLPLFGIPFAVKDNIDVAGVPTTAACPTFSYVPNESACVVQKILNAGGLFIGKTNMDQFAAGLVGTRSPYGACRNVYNAEYISGGSSSGSAVAVAAGLVPFALGTDTAGSGRVPAAFNNLVGYKPSRGIFSTHGVVPACRSLDCVSIFSHTSADARYVASVVQGYDARSFAPRTAGPARLPTKFRFGVPADSDLAFFGDKEAERLYHEAIARTESLGGQRVTIDYTPFRKAAELLYGGPWVAERFAGIAEFLAKNLDALFPVTRQILEKGATISGPAVFEGLARLDALRTQAAEEWKRMDVLLLPTAGTIYKVSDVVADPLTLNTNLGYYTNFVNLLDCSAIALPAGFRTDGLPFGITFIAPALHDAELFDLSQLYENPARTSSPSNESASSKIKLAVVGAHLQGQPLNRELTALNATLFWSGRTAPTYRFYALKTVPPKPGLVRVAEGGTSIDLEVWELEPEAFGRFVANVPPPLAIGTVQLETGEWVKGFVCEPAALTDAKEISHLGGWRRYLSSLATQK